MGVAGLIAHKTGAAAVVMTDGDSSVIKHLSEVRAIFPRLLPSAVQVGREESSRRRGLGRSKAIYQLVGVASKEVLLLSAGASRGSG